MTHARRLPWLATLLASLLLAACAALLGPAAVEPGTPAAEVLARLGQPTARYAASASGGERWQYSYEPWGRQVYNLDFDADGRVIRAEQVMNEALFAQRIQAGTWTRDDVLREYGPPAQVMGTRNFKGDIWVWRYENGPFPRFLYVDIAPDGVVQGYTLGDEYLDPPDWR